MPIGEGRKWLQLQVVIGGAFVLSVLGENTEWLVLMSLMRQVNMVQSGIAEYR